MHLDEKALALGKCLTIIVDSAPKWLIEIKVGKQLLSNPIIILYFTFSPRKLIRLNIIHN